MRLVLEALLTSLHALPLLMVNESALKLNHGETLRGDITQLCLHLYYVHALVAAGKIQSMHLVGKEAVADYLTKPVPPPIFLRCLKDFRVFMRWVMMTKKHVLNPKVGLWRRLLRLKNFMLDCNSMFNMGGVLMIEYVVST